jgi:hypothetical protein
MKTQSLVCVPDEEIMKGEPVMNTESRFEPLVPGQIRPGTDHFGRYLVDSKLRERVRRRYLSRPTHLRSKDDRDHSLLVKRWWATKCPNPRTARLAKHGEGYTA